MPCELLAASYATQILLPALARILLLRMNRQLRSDLRAQQLLGRHRHLVVVAAAVRVCQLAGQPWGLRPPRAVHQVRWPQERQALPPELREVLPQAQVRQVRQLPRALLPRLAQQLQELVQWWCWVPPLRKKPARKPPGSSLLPRRDLLAGRMRPPVDHRGSGPASPIASTKSVRLAHQLSTTS
jgi:hypothetical protein